MSLNIEKFNIHYYFKDKNKHSIDAFTRNKAEDKVLKLIKRICDIYKTRVSVLSEPPENGGYIEIFNMVIHDHIVDLLIGYALTALYTHKTKAIDLEQKRLI